MKIKLLLKKFALAILLITVTSKLQSQQTVTFNTNNLANGYIETGAGSMNSCWLLDSDIQRPRNTSNESRWAEMQLGSVRFPYGLGENYLWDTPPYGSSPLKPKIASTGYHPGIVKNANLWSWATNADRSINKSMDFDEFMGMCQRQNIKPLVVISTQAHKYPNGPTYQELKTTAVEWVKYAKRKGYEVAYWQLGNEVDGHRDLLPEAEYINLYVDFVTAMKAADPTILCGIGTKGSPSYFNTLIARAPQLIDYHSIHQYLFDHPISNYNTWLNHNGGDLNPKVTSVQNIINNSPKPNLPILITETNAFGNWFNADGAKSLWPSMYKGLTFFDMLMTQQSHEDVAYSYVWNSHSAWFGENGDGGVANALTNDMDNKITAMGMPVKILNTTAEQRYMIPNNKVQGSTYSYGTYTPATGKSTIYLLNKSTSAVTMNVNINNYDISNSYERWVWAPSLNQYSADYTFTRTGNITQTNSGFRTTIPASSLVVVKLNATSAINYLDNVGSNLRMKGNSVNTDVITTTTSDGGWRGKWNIIDAGNGYVFIQNQANGMRLQGTSSTLGTESSVKLVTGSSNGSWVQWKLTPVGNYYYIDNRAHNTRLSVNGTGEIVVGSTNWGGTWVQWKLTNDSSAKELNNKISTMSENTFDSYQISVYPNPVEGNRANIQYQLTEDSQISLEVYNIGGQVVHKVTDEIKGKGKHVDNLNTTNLPSGMYFLKVMVQPQDGSNPFIKTEKIIIK